MKKFILAFAFVAAVLPAVAQTASPVAAAKQQVPVKAQKTMQKTAAALPAEQRAVAYSKELQKKLSLDDGQYTKVLAVNTECIRRKDALKQATQKTPGASKQIAEYRMQQYQTILKPDQLAKLKAMNAQGGKQKAGSKAAVADPMSN